MNRWERRFKRRLKSIAAGYAQLSDHVVDQHEAIHRARRLTKHLRAILALLPDRLQHSIRKILRHQKQIVKQFGIVRDESLFWRTLERLVSAVELSSVGEDTASRVNNTVDLGFDLTASLQRLSKNVLSIQKQLQYSNKRIKRVDVASQWKKSFKSFLKRQSRLRGDVPLETWHDLRKAAKMLEYQIRFLRKYSHCSTGEFCELIVDLGKHLGQLNDLAKAKESLEKGDSPMGFRIPLDPGITLKVLEKIDKECWQAMEFASDLSQSLIPFVEEFIHCKGYEIIE